VRAGAWREGGRSRRGGRRRRTHGQAPSPGTGPGPGAPAPRNGRRCHPSGPAGLKSGGAPPQHLLAGGVRSITLVNRSVAAAAALAAAVQLPGAGERAKAVPAPVDAPTPPASALVPYAALETAQAVGAAHPYLESHDKTGGEVAAVSQGQRRQRGRGAAAQAASPAARAGHAARSERRSVVRGRRGAVVLRVVPLAQLEEEVGRLASARAPGSAPAAPLPGSCCASKRSSRMKQVLYAAPREPKPAGGRQVDSAEQARRMMADGAESRDIRVHLGAPAAAARRRAARRARAGPRADARRHCGAPQL
jgi:hypothetical protein